LDDHLIQRTAGEEVFLVMGEANIGYWSSVSIKSNEVVVVQLLVVVPEVDLAVLTTCNQGLGLTSNDHRQVDLATVQGNVVV
jgi:hypothetical protein